MNLTTKKQFLPGDLVGLGLLETRPAVLWEDVVSWNDSEHCKTGVLAIGDVALVVAVSAGKEDKSHGTYAYLVCSGGVGWVHYTYIRRVSSP